MHLATNLVKKSVINLVMELVCNLSDEYGELPHVVMNLVTHLVIGLANHQIR